MTVESGHISDEQRAITDLPVDTRTMVIAAAGTGKTHTLVARLGTLVERDGLCSGDDVLVLSFSRAAVAELRRRLGTLGGDARYVGAATFDVFATRLLAFDDPEGAWIQTGYEQRIRSAAGLLRQRSDLDLVKPVRHVLVDEIQDLVGARAELVMALLGRIDGGFTLFGDPAQAIYGHQLMGETGPTNAELYAWLRETFGASLSVRNLTQDHRAETQQTRDVARIGALLRDQHPDQVSIASQLRTTFLNLPSVTLVTGRRILVREATTPSAVLTRTNGEALRISQALFVAEIPHRYQRRGEDKAAAGWISEVVADIDTTRTTRTRLAEHLERTSAKLSSSPESLYRLLRMLDPGRGDELDLRRIADRVRCENFPEELNEVPVSAVVVSTIHRAKGLEFERVLLCDPRGHSRETEDLAEKNRILYVGLSRARRELYSIDAPDTAGLMVDPTTGRWIRRGFGPNRWKTHEFEVLGRDTHSLHPAGAWLVNTDVRDAQHYMSSTVRPGDPVTVELLRATTEGEPTAYYLVTHNGRPVAVTSDDFSRALRLAMGGRSRPAWPTRIEGLHVELIDTVVGHESVGRAHGIGSHGLWSRVRVFGLGTLRFGSDGRQEGD